MGYVGSYVWQLRQKVGDKKLLTTTVDVLPVDEAGRVKLIYAKAFDRWSTVGGHVEEGDSYASAALHELREEAGIIAHASDLELFATQSGSGRVYHYPDGDTQAFTVVFCLKQWQSEAPHTDTEEVATGQWFSLDEALQLNTNDATRQILTAYQRYSETGVVQMIEER